MTKQEINKRSKLVSSIELDPHQLADLSREILFSGHQLRFRAEGESMEPTILHGDVLTVSPVRNGIFFPGQIVMLTNSLGRSLVHRIVSIKKVDKKRVIQTCGDNASLKDKPIDDTQIIGIIKNISREGTQIKFGPLRRLFGSCWYLLRAMRVPNH